MKKTLTRLLVAFAALLALNACRKDQAYERYTENDNHVKPDLSIKVTSSVAGFILNENNEPVPFAKVTAGSKEIVTDEFGYFSLADASVPEAAGLVKVEKTGYFNGYKTFLPQVGKESFVRIKLLPKNNPGSVDAISGGTVTIATGASITLPGNAVVLAAGGSSYTGAVNIAVQYLDPTDLATHQYTQPGDARGIDAEEHLAILKSFGTLAVELTGSAGQLLQIAAGKQATISIPIPASLSSAAPSSVPLWSFDETNGLWKQESTLQKNGTTYTGQVSHFSFWDGATGIPLVNLTTQIVDVSLQPLAHVAVGVRYTGQPFNAGFGTFGYTDANGYIHASVPANANLTLSVLTPCETEAYSTNFSTTNGNIDLGTITGNLGQSHVTITGIAVDCNNQPVTNGYVQSYDNGFFNRIPIVNGAFSYTGVACGNAMTHLVVIDDNAHQQSETQSVMLNTGLNDLGTISACGTSIVGTISYTLDAVTKTFTEPADTLSSYFLSQAGWTLVLKIIASQSTNPDFNFQFDGGNATGTGHKVTEIFSKDFPGGRLVAPVPLTVTITEYGKPGSFISGSFSGLVLDFATNAPHNISCTFRVRRFQ
jgi:hypothetical protein